MAESGQGHERRKYHRIPTDQVISFAELDARDQLAVSKNLSTGGIAFEVVGCEINMGDVLRRLGDLLTKHKEDIADGMTREMGKVLAETRGDVQEGIDTAYALLFLKRATSGLPGAVGGGVVKIPGDERIKARRPK